MRVIEDTKFELTTVGGVVRYVSKVVVEVGGETFSASREMTPDEYDKTYPMLRDYFHGMLKSDVMNQIEKRIFIEGAKE